MYRPLDRVRVVMAALAIPPLVGLVPLNSLVRWLDRPGRARASGTGPPDDVVAAWVTTVLRWLPGPWRNTCLRRSVVLYRLLRRAGRPVALCIGVRRSAAGEFAAHAWLLLDEAPYLEPQPSLPSDYTLIARFPETAVASPPDVIGRPAG